MRLRGAAGLAAVSLFVLSGLVLSGCTIEVGPPPESDPPLVPPEAKGPPPPAQPTESQAWSRDLDFSNAPAASNPEEMQDGLVAATAEGITYSRQRLTYQSAFNDEKPPSEAEQARQRARERAAAAGLPPPPSVTAAPVAEVSEQSLPPVGAEAAPQRESRLPPPPDFPPVAPERPEANPEAVASESKATPTQEAAAAPESASSASAAHDDSRWESSRLPPPPKFPTNIGREPAATEEAPPPEAVEGAAEPATAEAPGQEAPQETLQKAAAVAEPQTLPPETASGSADQTGGFVAEAWDAPPGTILVQVSAVQQKTSVPVEWDRLRGRFPEVLSPLRLVIDEARLGEKGVFYRVQAGAFGSQEVAAAACDNLISQGQACFVVVR